ncbi:cyclophilin peptidyl-prolyl cis-trans isomerase Cyp8 [Coemansia sp. RSA 1807]|nr:cyclophilin peptidyl-prolyl cis-trans isomerase Cyp8 [Coemansia sp. RSA 1591]KAJ1767517.1 cyclophilin peptidyl-prolyl cis-trans isomerase Cyp8 [Coemansia sp. RSA 1752]KAJ1778020.1 cyclophilin peptidyl-prolyl cis-trans isomerase Cyp8 [Coemansia sp. RSA 1824]KAJ1791641.1 cyclophilin peptidyl-prolyl cis-trans isomerase Cyp8 [Coemansia sp. RSA 2167]KAJ1794873.1 cyclophilin peptidyl-prolyl cis-trans isomerase Cyp8 [Coemansia sp. RSA 1938]KAJ2275480.1 cyclophilin peptidyl-prolyl cis-trans isomera
MGRGRDKLYISQGEWSNAHDDSKGLRFGGKNTCIAGKQDTTEKLAFDCCALSLKPFTVPMCTPDGFVFDADNIKSYVKETHKHPFTDEPLELNDLIELNYHKNLDGSYVDPVTLAQFSEFTKIAANKKSKNVYLWSTIEEFNIKPGSWSDLMTSEPFERDDIIVLQDPNAPKKAYNTAKASAKETAAGGVETKKVGKPLQAGSLKSQPHNAAKYSKGLAAASLTSTAVAPVTKNESELIDDEEYMFARIKSKGYARLVTNLGDINIELYCDKAPRTCYNFIKLATSGYYNGTKFHRSIKNFMLQGGDPTGTGSGGKSYWGTAFKDEFGKKLSHSERGVLSMANRGPNTNTSQFFILYREAKHLDRKHAIFGRVVGGLPALSKMEAVPCDDNDCPKKDIVISKVSVFVDPYAEFAQRQARKVEHQKNQEDLALGKRQRTVAEEEQLERETTTWFGTKVPSLDTAHNAADDSTAATKTVGKYLKKPKFDTPARPTNSNSQLNKKTDSGYKFGDFSNW